MDNFIYKTDISDAEWVIFEPMLDERKTKPRRHSLRAVLNGLFYLVKTGCQWKYIPKGFPPWSVCRYYFDKWTKSGLWEKINAVLSQKARLKMKKKADPSMLIIDSQSVKTSFVGGTKGYDAGKNISGCKRHIAVDTNGLVVGIWVHSASFQDRDAGRVVLREANWTNRCKKVDCWVADAGYAGEMENEIIAELGWYPLIIRRNKDAQGFELLPKRSVVERTFAWFDAHRRLSKDYEKKSANSESMAFISMIRLLSKRLETKK